MKAVPCYALCKNILVVNAVRNKFKHKYSCFGLFEEGRGKEFLLASESNCWFALAPKSATKSAHNGI